MGLSLLFVNLDVNCKYVNHFVVLFKGHLNYARKMIILIMRLIMG